MVTSEHAEGDDAWCCASASRNSGSLNSSPEVGKPDERLVLREDVPLVEAEPQHLGDRDRCRTQAKIASVGKSRRGWRRRQHSCAAACRPPVHGLASATPGSASAETVASIRLGREGPRASGCRSVSAAASFRNASIAASSSASDGLSKAVVEPRREAGQDLLDRTDRRQREEGVVLRNVDEGVEAGVFSMTGE